MNLKCIGIDIGHNLRCDVGAVAIRREDELNLLVGKSLIKRFMAKGIKVVEWLPPSASSYRDSLSKRCRAANYGKVDIFISIHHNACPGGYGSECLCIKGGQQNALSEKLSKVILEEICKLGFRNRGVKDRRDLYVINNTTMPAIIVECAFVDSARDMNGYDSEKMAEAIFRGVCRFYEISVSVDQGELGGTSSPKYHVVQKGDTLWGISRKYGVSVERLIEINGIKDRNSIYVGQKVLVRFRIMYSELYH